MPANRVAIVEDEDNLRDTLAFALRREGYVVDAYSDGLEAWTALRSGLPGLVILDILMPRMDGLELCRKIRGMSETVPILFLTSKDDELDRVLGLELGADDYLCKPFSMRELIARVRVLFRRLAHRQQPAEAPAEAPLRVGDLELDLQRFIARWKGTQVDLTVTEFTMLQALARRPGYVKTRQQLTREGYPHDTYVSERTIDSHIKRLRRKFEEADPAFNAIETVHGLGYRYAEPESA